MSGGLVALLDDIATLAKVTASSIDDVAANAVKASSKAVGVVIDDTAVTPQYGSGLSPARELPIIGKIARGSLINKLFIILPIALLLTWLAPSVFFLYGIQIFETTGYALYAVASVYWVNDMTAPADRVQGQTYFTMANTLGIVLSSFLGGFLLDAAGTGPTLAFSTVTGGTGMGILWIMLRQGQAKAAVQQG